MEQNNSAPLKPFAYHIGVYALLLIGIHSIYRFTTQIPFYKKLNNEIKEAINAYNQQNFIKAIDHYRNVLRETSLNEENQKRFAFAYCACEEENSLEKGIHLLSNLFQTKKYKKQEFSDLKKEFFEVTQRDLEEFFAYEKAV